jgi:hypothetical protein
MIQKTDILMDFQIHSVFNVFSGVTLEYLES